MKLREYQFDDDHFSVERIKRRTNRFSDDNHPLTIDNPIFHSEIPSHVNIQLHEITKQLQDNFTLNSHPQYLVSGCSIVEKSLNMLGDTIQKTDLPNQTRNLAWKEYLTLVNMLHRLFTMQVRTLVQKEQNTKSSTFEGYDTIDAKNIRISIRQRLVAGYSPIVNRTARTNCQIRIRELDTQRSDRGFAIGLADVNIRFGLRTLITPDSAFWSATVESGKHEQGNKKNWQMVYPLSQAIEAAKHQGVNGLSTVDGAYTFHFPYEPSQKSNFKVVENEFSDFNFALYQYFSDCHSPFRYFGTEQRREHKKHRYASGL